MSKQEEIRDYIKDVFLGIRASGYEGSYFSAEDAVEDFLAYLASQGVVIKADRELPTCPISLVLVGNKQAFGCPYFNGGYVVTEPLVEEG